MSRLNQKIITTTLQATSKDKKKREVSDGNGLVLIVGPRGGVWYWRAELHDRQRRLRLGSLESLTLSEARIVAGEATRMLKDGIGLPNEEWLEQQRRRLGKLPKDQAVELRERLSMTFDQARSLFLAEVIRTRRAGTARDYAGKLRAPELEALAHEPVASITLSRMSKAIHAIGGRGAYAMSEGCTRTVKSMWSWLAQPAQADKSRVPPDVMRRLRPPERPIAEEGEEGLYVPPPLEVGRIMAIAKSGALDLSRALAVQLLVYTAQRRLSVVSAERDHFTARAGADDGLWTIPARNLKSGRRREGTHVIPLPASAWTVVRQAEQHGYEKGSPYVFPGKIYGSEGRLPIHPDGITHVFSHMPGVNATPHDARRAFGTHGEAILGRLPAMTSHILNHGGGDVGITAKHYSLHNRTHVTWPVMDAWVAWVDEQTELAIAEDPRLLDVEWLRAEIEKADAAQRGREVLPL